jgi:hypothetical protein
VISEMPSYNSHLILGSLYPSRSQGIDLGVSIENVDKETVVVKVSVQ